MASSTEMWSRRRRYAPTRFCLAERSHNTEALSEARCSAGGRGETCRSVWAVLGPALDLLTLGPIPWPWIYACGARVVKRLGKTAVVECPHSGEKEELVAEWRVDGRLVKRVVLRACRDCLGGLG